MVIRAQDHVKPAEMDAFLGAQFTMADADRDGLVTVGEFAAYYQGLVTCKARQQLRSSMGLDAERAPHHFNSGLCVGPEICGEWIKHLMHAILQCDVEPPVSLCISLTS